MYLVRRDMIRPPRELTSQIARYPTTIISDAMGRYGVMTPNMRPLYQSARVAGPAVTVETYPVDNLMCHVGLKLAQPGDVLVISGRVGEGGIWGELMSRNALRKGLAGAVVDGGVRDQADIRTIGFPVFSTAVTPRGTFKSGAGSVNVPVSCAGLTVRPGDIVVGDEDGVVVVPREHLGEVIERCQAKVEYEETLRGRIDAGEDLYELLGIDKQLRQTQIKGMEAAE